MQHSPHIKHARANTLQLDIRKYPAGFLRFGNQINERVPYFLFNHVLQLHHFTCCNSTIDHAPLDDATDDTADGSNCGFISNRD